MGRGLISIFGGGGGELTLAFATDTPPQVLGANVNLAMSLPLTPSAQSRSTPQMQSRVLRELHPNTRVPNPQAYALVG